MSCLKKIQNAPRPSEHTPVMLCHIMSCHVVLCMVITYSKGMDQPGKVANPAGGQLNRGNYCFPVPVRA